MILDYASQIGRRVTRKDFAVAVAKAEGRRKPYSGSIVGEWIAERSVPSLDAIAAMAKVTGRDRAWVAWGERAVSSSAVDSLPRDASEDVPASATPRAPATPTRRKALGGGR